MTKILTYRGGEVEGLIADGTNPWIEVNGVVIDWTKTELPRVLCPCGEGYLVVLPGVLEAMDLCEGVQRCDSCGTYDGDLSAAEALARLVGGIVKYEAEPASTAPRTVEETLADTEADIYEREVLHL